MLGAGLQTQWMQRLHEDVAEGDAFLHNDPYLGNTHSADHTLLVPVFIDGEHFLTVSAKAHQADCGNSAPSTYMPFATDIYEEGALTFPCVRVQRDYKDVDDIIRMCRARIRVPDVFGTATTWRRSAPVRVGERRLHELVAKYGVATLREFIVDWLDYSERRMTQAIRELPACRLEASSAHDVLPGDDEQVTIQRRNRAGSRRRADRGGSEGQRRLPAVRAQPLRELCPGGRADRDLQLPARRRAAQRRQLSPHRCAAAGGLHRWRADFPHSASMATTNLLNRLINSVQSSFRALGDGYGLAEGAGALGAGFAVVSGIDKRENRGWSLCQRGRDRQQRGPGVPEADGWLTYAMPDCAKTIYIDSIEVLEQKYPLRFRSLRLLEGQRRARQASRRARQRDDLRPDQRHDAGLLLRGLRRQSATRGRRWRARRRGRDLQG